MDIVGTEHLILSDENHPFMHGLGNHKAVKRIFVVIRKAMKQVEVLRHDCQQCNGIGPDMIADQDTWRGWHCQSAEAGFDGDLPNAGNAQIPFVAWVLDQPPSVAIELRVSSDKPQEGVGIEQDLHGM